jgi:hypothetical protein
VNDGLLRSGTIQLVAENEENRVYPYSVGDYAFPLAEHSLKNYDVGKTDARDDPAKMMFNKRLTY